jgi:hypothetical protein
MAFKNYTLKIIKMPWIEKWLFLKGFITSHIVYFGINILPSRIILSRLNVNDKSCRFLESIDYSAIKLVHKTFKRIALISPGDLNCMHKVIVYKILLHELGIESKIMFSVKTKNESFTNAHTWLFVNSKLKLFQIKDYTDINN